MNRQFRHTILSVLLVGCITIPSFGNVIHIGGIGSEYDYGKSIRELQEKLQSTPERNRKEIYHELMKLCHVQANLYSLLWRTSAIAGTIYFSLIEDKEHNYTNYSTFYHAVYLFEAGDFTGAISKLSGLTSETRGINDELRELAQIWLGAAYYARGDRDRARQAWGAVSMNAHASRTELAYVLARSQSDIQQAKHLLSGISVNNMTQREYRAILQLSLAQENTGTMLAGIDKLNSTTPIFIENKGQANEFRYYDPSALYTIAQIHYFLSYYYAGRLQEKTDINEQRKLRVHYYKAKYYYLAGKYDRVIQLLTGEGDLLSAVYLGAAFYMTGQIDQALNIFKYLETHGDPETLSELGVLYAEIGITGTPSGSVEIAERALNDATKQIGRHRLPQSYFQNLGFVYLMYERYDDAIETFSQGFRRERRSDLRANSPEYNIIYGLAILKARHFISIHEAIEMFSTVLRSYSDAAQLVEFASLIDVTTTVGREGRMIYKK